MVSSVRVSAALEPSLPTVQGTAAPHTTDGIEVRISADASTSNEDVLT